MKNTPNPEIEFSAHDLIEAMQEGVTILQAGRIGELRTRKLLIPPQIKSIPPQRIKTIRNRLGASQAVFAQMLNVPRATAIAWESGARKPSGAALKLLHIAEKQPQALLA